MLEGDLDLVNELSPQKFLLLTDFLCLHSRESGDATQCIPVDFGLLIKCSLPISDDILSEFQIAKCLIKLLLNGEETFLDLLPLYPFLAQLLSHLIEVEVELLGDGFQVLLLHAELVLVTDFLILVFEDSTQLGFQSLKVVFRGVLEFLKGFLSFIVFFI